MCRITSAVLLVSTFPLAAQTLEALIASRVDALKDALIAQRRDFHMNPELSNREERTARVIAEKLKALGLEDIRTGVSRHGVVAMLRGAKPGPVVAIRADMDALPVEETLDVPYKSKNKGVKHACGHDIHMTVALGAAEVLSGMRDQLAGSVKFIFQPAEEGAPKGEESGAVQMIKEGALENPKPQVIFALHDTPQVRVGQIGYAPGPMLASSDSFTIRIIGKKVHAAWPHQGIDPIVVSAETIAALQTIRSRRIDPLEPMVLTIGSIHGGNRQNIIADEVVMEGTVRTHNEQVRERVRTLMKEILSGVAGSHGAAAEISWSPASNPPTINNTAVVEAALPVLRRVAGAGNVIQTPPVMGAEDYAYFLKAVPGFMFWLGVGNPERGMTAMLHTADFDADEASLPLGVKAMANLVFDYLDRHRP
jgi:amidohydrolase